MAKTATVKLAGREYTITELPLRANAEWRKGLVALADDLFTLLQGAGLQFTPGVVADLAKRATQLLIETPGDLMDLLCDYAPDIAAQREQIEAEAYDSEVAAAFSEVLGLAFPFGSLLKSIGNLTGGSLKKPTSPSSPAPNGASGKTS